MIEGSLSELTLMTTSAGRPARGGLVQRKLPLYRVASLAVYPLGEYGEKNFDDLERALPLQSDVEGQIPDLVRTKLPGQASV